eukprot:3342800-Prorocentrum_lima.AAC.1
MKSTTGSSTTPKELWNSWKGEQHPCKYGWTDMVQRAEENIDMEHHPVVRSLEERAQSHHNSVVRQREE